MASRNGSKRQKIRQSFNIFFKKQKPDFKISIQFQYFNRKQDCCDNQVINTAEKTCCGGVITEKVAGEICCGGEKRPESKNEKCCGDKVFFDPTANGCCGGETFDRCF